MADVTTEKPRRRKSFAEAAIAGGAAPAVIYVRRADLRRLLAAARALVALETATARNSHSAPGRRKGRAFHEDWRDGDPEHFETVQELNAARQRITHSIARR